MSAVGYGHGSAAVAIKVMHDGTQDKTNLPGLTMFVRRASVDDSTIVQVPKPLPIVL